MQAAEMWRAHTCSTNAQISSKCNLLKCGTRQHVPQAENNMPEDGTSRGDENDDQLDSERVVKINNMHSRVKETIERIVNQSVNGSETRKRKTIPNTNVNARENVPLCLATNDQKSRQIK